MVQLLAYGFVLQLLSIQFIWRSKVSRQQKQVSSDWRKGVKVMEEDGEQERRVVKAGDSGREGKEKKESRSLRRRSPG